jgi:integral membrane protein
MNADLQKTHRQIQTLRWIALAEGISFMVLLLIAMPMKYYWGIPEAVKFTGWAHGVLFMLYIGAVFLSMEAMQWGFLSVVLALAASVVPLGPFFMDGSVKRRLQELEEKQEGVEALSTDVREKG